MISITLDLQYRELREFPVMTVWSFFVTHRDIRQKDESMVPIESNMGLPKEWPRGKDTIFLWEFPQENGTLTSRPPLGQPVESRQKKKETRFQG